MTKLFLTSLDEMGAPTEKLGDSIGGRLGSCRMFNFVYHSDLTRFKLNHKRRWAP